jgi:hypothetical protein
MLPRGGKCVITTEGAVSLVPTTQHNHANVPFHLDERGRTLATDNAPGFQPASPSLSWLLFAHQAWPRR